MDSEPGRSFILWTVRLAVALYAAACWRYASPVRRDRRFAVLWAASWLMCVVHVLCAFHFEHRWRHAAALEHTAAMTERVTGLNWAGGLYINYVFLSWWACDVFRWLWRTSVHTGVETASTGMGYFDLSIHAVAAFMMFNATAVFGPMWWWIPVTGFIAAVVWKQFYLPASSS